MSKLDSASCRKARNQKTEKSIEKHKRMAKIDILFITERNK